MVFVPVTLRSDPPSIPLAADKASKDISSMETWFKHNGLHLNCSKTQILHFHNHQLNVGHVSVKLELGELINSAETTRFLSLNINENLKWSDHLSQINSSLAKALFGFRVIFRTTGINAALTVYHSYCMSEHAKALFPGVAPQSSTAYLSSKKSCTDLGRRRSSLFLSPPFLRNEIVDNTCCLYFSTVHLC
jgi:hypothetical protein